MNYKYTISIQKDTNKIISSSDDKFAGIGNGSLIKIENEPVLHTVIGRESFFYIKSFQSNDSKIIVIDSDTGFNLQKYDVINITYKEYEAKFLIDILNKGTGYVIGNKINVKGGVLSFDISIGSGQPTILEVTETGENGGVEKLNIINNGKYITCPPNPYETYSERGQNLSLDIKYTELGNRSFLERVITDIYFKEGKTYLVLDYSLPLNLKEGKISCNKNILLLSTNYNAESQRNCKYEIFSNFTPNIKLPLLLKNSTSPDVIYNQSLKILDEQIGIIKKKLGIL